MNWNIPGVDEMQMHRGAGYTIPDEIREQIITMDAQGMEVEDIIGMGMPEDVVSQVLIENKVEGRNPAQAMQPMKFPTGQSLAGKYPTSPQDEIAKSFSTEMMQAMPQQQMAQQVPDPREMDIMNPRFNRYA